MTDRLAHLRSMAKHRLLRTKVAYLRSPKVRLQYNSQSGPTSRDYGKLLFLKYFYFF